MCFMEQQGCLFPGYNSLVHTVISITQNLHNLKLT